MSHVGGVGGGGGGGAGGGTGGLSVYTEVQTQQVQQQSRAQALAEESFGVGGASTASQAAGTDKASQKSVNLLA